jgi:XTP/dITP diphosphohydrolase
MRLLLLGTRNPGKLREMTNILEGSGWSFSSLQNFEHVGSAEENGVTYSENAIAKAQFYAAATGLVALADDSGLEVATLSGAPGVYSARYAGENASDADRHQLLLSELSKTSNTDRRARFVCVVAIADPTGTILNISTGICSGTLTFAPRGAGGFGYDPLFIPDGHTQTFAELPQSLKNLISHRALALAQTKQFLAADLR